MERKTLKNVGAPRRPKKRSLGSWRKVKRRWRRRGRI
jgi:hypothetical protein